MSDSQVQNIVWIFFLSSIKFIFNQVQQGKAFLFKFTLCHALTLLQCIIVYHLNRQIIGKEFVGIFFTPTRVRQKTNNGQTGLV